MLALNETNPYLQRGRTALIRASKRGHLKVVRLLLDHGADINHADIVS